MHHCSFIVLIIIVVSLCCSQASASFGFLNYDICRGTVREIDLINNSLVVENSYTYENICETVNGVNGCSWKLYPMNLTNPRINLFTTENLSEITDIRQGDTVVAGKCHQVDTVTWRVGTLARLQIPNPEETYMTDLVGSPSDIIPLTFKENYTFRNDLTPNCVNCEVNCDVSAIDMTLLKEALPVYKQRLRPGDFFSYTNPTDGSGVMGKFLSPGSEFEDKCRRGSPLYDVEPALPSYAIHINPPNNGSETGVLPNNSPTPSFYNASPLTETLHVTSPTPSEGMTPVHVIVTVGIVYFFMIANRK